MDSPINNKPSGLAWLIGKGPPALAWLTRKGPNILAWLIVLLALPAIVSGVYEIVPLLYADKLHGGFWTSLIQILIQTHYFKFFFAIILAVTTCRFSWQIYVAVSHVFHAYISDPLNFVDHAIVLAFIVGFVTTLICFYKDRDHLNDIAKDPLFLFGAGVVSNSAALLIGASFGQSRNRQQTRELEASVTVATRKIIGLHQLINSLQPPPRIPPELDL